jgi:ribosomal protein S14
MKQNIKDIVLYKYTKKKEVKKEIKKKILKSIIQNNNITQNYKIFAQYKLELLNKNNKFFKNKKICLLSGKKASINKYTTLSRHMVKQLNILGKIQNLKLKSW